MKTFRNRNLKVFVEAGIKSILLEADACLVTLVLASAERKQQLF